MCFCHILLCYSKALMLFCSAFRDKNQMQYIETLRMHACNTYWIDWVTIHCDWWCYKLADIVNVRVLSLRLHKRHARSMLTWEEQMTGWVLASRLSHSASRCLCWGMFEELSAFWHFYSPPDYFCSITTLLDADWLSSNEIVQNGSDSPQSSRG